MKKAFIALTIPSRKSVSTTFHTYKLKKSKQSARYSGNDLSRAYANFNVNVTSKRAVQTLKKSLKNHPDVKRMNRPYHFGMPLENKVYTAKRQETLKKLANAKMLRASQKIKTKLNSSKRTRIKE